MLKFGKEGFSIIFLILSSLISIYLCLDDASILLVPFKGKSLQQEEDPEDYSEPYWSQEDDYDYPYSPSIPVYNASTFISHWFYNGMYTLANISSKMIESYINMENSILSIEKCKINRIYSTSTMRENSYYRPLNSETYSKIDKKSGNDIFTFIGDFRRKIQVNIGEKKGSGLDFYFREEDNDSPLCGNLGLNLNTNLDKTNFILQLN